MLKDNSQEFTTDIANEARLWQRIGSEAVHAAQEESRRMGVPNVYSINGHIYYELPDGTLSLGDPWHGKNTPPE